MKGLQLIPGKTKKEIMSVLDSIDPDRADSVLRAVIDESTSMLHDLTQHKPCDERTAWRVYEDHKKRIIKQIRGIIPEEPEGINEVINSILDVMRKVILTHKGKTWK